MFEACLTVATGSARIHHTADSNEIALFEFSDIETGSGNATYDFMVSAGLLKPEVDWRAGYTDRFVKGLKLSM